ncbi:MAG TPA: MotA/TolQ/ExbB proton channel family protein, partial [Burkholderiales bacterium]|nr:MotA/TolQ/ExbB proton channel family protein [Burkholderiales bacterium]
MFSIIEAAGWPIWPLILCSVIALAIIGERTWSLRRGVVMRRDLLEQVLQEYRQNGVSASMITRLAADSPLGQIFAAGLRNANSSSAVMKEA